MLDFIIYNKELIKLFYGLIIGLICAIIVIKTDRLFRLSFHKGIQYFRNAFFFYGIAFIIRYIFGAVFSYNLINPDYSYLVMPIFAFFLIMAGFFLLYSLIWKKIEPQKTDYTSSLLNQYILIFYIMSIIFVVLDFIWHRYYFLFFSQIVIFLLASAISFNNYFKNNGRKMFPKFYFIAMLMSLAAWILNALAGLYFSWHPLSLMGIYILNIIIFLLFLFGVIKVINMR